MMPASGKDEWFLFTVVYEKASSSVSASLLWGRRRR